MIGLKQGGSSRNALIVRVLCCCAVYLPQPALLYAQETPSQPLTLNAAVAPDGTTTAALLVPSTSSASHFAQSPGITTTTQVTVSFFVKAAGYTHAAIASSSNNWVYVNLTTGAIESSIGNTELPPTVTFVSVASGSSSSTPVSGRRLRNMLNASLCAIRYSQAANRPGSSSLRRFW